ncbi:hypothetical protein [Amaricoccus macauensis]|uniref:hypothetical protein n=1 Tax=Amaricoccus macauensis TaxID=57001 RepID=UPI003C7E7B21
MVPVSRMKRAATRLPVTRRLVAGLLVAGLAALPGAAQEEPGEAQEEEARVVEPAPLPRPLPPWLSIDPGTAADLFAMPVIAAEIREAGALADAGETGAATLLLDRLVLRHPDLAELRVNRAALAMLEGFPEAARADLEAAAEAGMEMAPLLSEPVFAELAADAAFASRLADLAAERDTEPGLAPTPTPAWSGRAVVSAANTVWNPETGRLEPRFAFAPEPSAPVLPVRPRTAASDLLREHEKRGRAAGNNGDLYDNRDRGHSALERAAHPQLAHVVYDDAAKRAGVDYGLAGPFLFDRPVLGNSSTAITSGPAWRSLPRHAYTYPDGAGPLRLWQEARANHLYVYPAHEDFTDEGGDLFPANTPYILISRGSSGSDKPLLEAVAMILAAFRPDTKERLIAEGLVTPTVQMVFRRSLQNVRSRESYFSSDAQRAAFDGFDINLARMVSLANAIRVEDIPAEVRIAVEAEDLGREGVDFFGEGLSEQLFDTPRAVARVWRSKTGRREMILSAEESRDPNGRALAFEWRLLQGDPEKVTIEPLDGGARARITLDWHAPFEISEELPVTSSRVDIGVFAHNGVHDSAPAILSWYFPPQETRTYETGPDDTPRIVSIDHADPEKAETYADPVLTPGADWRDTYRYGPGGALEGWVRVSPRGEAHFTPQGARILAVDAAGHPERTVPVSYPLVEDADGRLAVEEVPAGE